MITAATCAVPFSQSGASANSACAGCEDPMVNPGGGDYCIPGDYVPLPIPGYPFPTPTRVSPTNYPCVEPAFPPIL